MVNPLPMRNCELIPGEDDSICHGAANLNHPQYLICAMTAEALVP